MSFITGDLIWGLPWNQPLCFVHRSSLPIQEALQVNSVTVTGQGKPHLGSKPQASCQGMAMRTACLWRPGLPCELPIRESKELDIAQGVEMVCVTLGSQGASLDCKGSCFASCVPPSPIPDSVVNSHSNGDPFCYHFLSTPLALSMERLYTF